MIEPDLTSAPKRSVAYCGRTSRTLSCPTGRRLTGAPDKQPVWITPDDENPNGADILVLTDGAAAGDIGAWRRCLDMFDGRDETAVTDARRWSDYKAADHDLTYWQQTERGGWEKQG